MRRVEFPAEVVAYLQSFLWTPEHCRMAVLCKSFLLGGNIWASRQSLTQDNILCVLSLCSAQRLRECIRFLSAKLVHSPRKLLQQVFWFAHKTPRLGAELAELFHFGTSLTTWRPCFSQWFESLRMDKLQSRNHGTTQFYDEILLAPVVQPALLLPGDICDACDPFGSWYLAQVCFRSGDQVFVDYVGFTHSCYNEWLWVDSARVAAKGTHPLHSVSTSVLRLRSHPDASTNTNMTNSETNFEI